MHPFQGKEAFFHHSTSCMHLYLQMLLHFYIRLAISGFTSALSLLVSVCAAVCIFLTWLVKST